MFSHYNYSSLSKEECRISIYDTDFEEHYNHTYNTDEAFVFVGTIKAIINIYGKRNLDVVKNLYLYFKHREHQKPFKNGWDVIYWAEEHIPEFKPYIAELKDKIKFYELYS